jgi:hypothetical protein
MEENFRQFASVCHLGPDFAQVPSPVILLHYHPHLPYHVSVAFLPEKKVQNYIMAQVSGVKGVMVLFSLSRSDQDHRIKDLRSPFLNKKYLRSRS